MPEMSIDEREKRKARRAERRQKQREANIERAAKMHEVRIHSEDRSIAISSGGPGGKVHIGCSGWYYWHLQGLFYPVDAPRNQWFSFYEREFKTVELNAPFYSWPTLAAVKTWLRQATDDFVYTIKVCELITHVRRFEDCDELIRDFGYIADMLGKRMGCFLFQLPPSIRYSPETLQLVLRQLDPCRRNVVEFRHKSWWNDEVFRQFKATGAIFCSCSGPRLPDELVKTADEIYIRFHGTTQWYRHDYSEAELAIWADRIRSSGAKTVWAYFNNDRDAYAIKNARMLSRLLGDV
ncbi:DUF72 domain-containing protein [Rhizobium sp. CCGE 510]|uniref:DUF72 domain-containing protein n=1 Tax=Rhizobium sp. CCGE 510 TaxID=1132836 RepID=UPI000305D8F2|nr:DUF72 domain-containing protein [Rhizobium sp. CCGE 510]